MTIYEIGTPQAVTTKIGSFHEKDEGCRIVLGVGYTASDAIAAYARRKNFAVNEVDEIPADYLEKCARLDAFPVELRGAPLIDGLDPQSVHKITGPDGVTVYDIRDIVNGVVTTGPDGIVITGPLTA